MIIRSVLESPSAVTVAVAPDEGEGEELFVLSPGEWKRLNRSLGYDPAAGLVLSAPQPADEAVYDALRAAHARTAAVRDAGKLLAFSDRSRAALIRRLRERGHSREAALYAADFLEKKGLLDDGEACRRYALSAVRAKHAGPRRIAAYLVSRGFSPEDAREAAESVDPGDYREALLWQIRKKCPALLDAKSEPDADALGKAMAALMRQGFGADEIRALLREERCPGG